MQNTIAVSLVFFCWFVITDSSSIILHIQLMTVSYDFFTPEFLISQRKKQKKTKYGIWKSDLFLVWNILEVTVLLTAKAASVRLT